MCFIFSFAYTNHSTLRARIFSITASTIHSFQVFFTQHLRLAFSRLVRFLNFLLHTSEWQSFLFTLLFHTTNNLMVIT